jgi:hypothetical protein
MLARPAVAQIPRGLILTSIQKLAKFFPCHTSKISPVTPLFATHPKTPSRKFFVCHTCETPRGPSRVPPCLPLFHKTPSRDTDHRAPRHQPVALHRSQFTSHFLRSLSLTFRISPHTILSSTRGGLSLLRAANNPKLPRRGQRFSTGGKHAHQSRYKRLRPYRP